MNYGKHQRNYNLKKSHNDYWCSRQIESALEVGCNIIECDIIYKDGDLLLSHSWRPKKSMCYGDLVRYLSFFKNWIKNERIYLCIEIKTQKYAVVYKLWNMLIQYKNDNVIYVIDAHNTLFEPEREDRALEIYRMARHDVNIIEYKDFKIMHEIEGIETVALYKDKPWWKRLNHF